MITLAKSGSFLGVATVVTCLISLASPSLAQETGNAQAGSAEQPVPAAPRADPALVEARARRTGDQAVARFLDRKKQQQRRERVLGERGGRADFQELRGLYRASAIPKPEPRAQLSAASVAALGEILETDAVQLLQALDLRPAGIKRLAGAGLDPLAAAAAYIRGTSTIVDQAVPSDLVAVVRVTGVRDERLADGFRSTVLIEVVDPIAGRAPAQPIALRQLSGQDADGTRVEV